MKWIPFALLSVTALPLAAQSGSGPGRPVPPKSPRVFVLDCGGMHQGEKQPDLAVPCYLIAHPKGALMWDVGLFPDKDRNKTPGNPAWILPAHSFAEELASTGYTPDDITYIAFSHYHSDHTANANVFGHSTWLVSKVERDVMFSNTPPRFVDPSQYSELKAAKTKILPSDSDYDVFGDGTVIIKPAPGHTPGHQVLFVKLVKTGPILIAGDLYVTQQDRVANKPPSFDANKDQSVASRVRIEAFLKSTGAQIWIEHDYPTFARLKKAPAYYE